VKAQFKQAGFGQVSLEPSGGGVFEITVNGKLVFSKKALGRFPSDSEIASFTD